MQNFNQKNIIKKTDQRYEEYSKDTFMQGNPDYIYNTNDISEIKQILNECYNKNIPITFAASQTSMTGASTTNDGIILSIREMNKVLDVSTWQNKNIITVEPGIISSDLQKYLSNLEFFYPAVPTSKDESRIGGNVSTNAFGEDSFKYGPIRKYVRRLKIIRIDGKELILERKQDEVGSSTLGYAGYFQDWKNPIDLFIGSEGTLGFISEITLSLLPKEKSCFLILLPFNSNLSAISKIVEIVKNNHEDLRALEFIDEGACENLKTADGFPNTKTHAYLYLKIEYDNLDVSFNKWSNILSLNKFESTAIVAKTPIEIETMIKWRQHIPNMNKERKKEIEKTDGKKVSGDWWVPINNLLEMMKFFYDGANKLGCFHMAYAHMGQGHPHTSFFAKNKEQISLAKEFQLECCKKAVMLGGGVAGEHGIGKAYTHLLKIQHNQNTLNKFMKWKKEYDPKNLLGRGNIFGS